MRADEADDTDACIVLEYEDAYALLAVLAASTTKTLREQMLYLSTRAVLAARKAPHYT